MSIRVPWPAQLSSRRLVLRPFVTADHEAWLRGFATRQPPRSRHDGGPHDPIETPRSWFRRKCARQRQLWLKDECYVLGVFDKASGRHYGHVDVFVIERQDRQWGNLGYAVHNTAQCRGIATEACAAAIPWAFATLGLHRLEAVISPDNAASLGVARKLGLEYECLRKSFEREDDTWVDQVVYVAVEGLWKGPEES